MNKKLYAKRVYHAIENIDAELLYDARAYRAPKIKPYLRYIAAAVIVLAVISTALILTARNAVKSTITIDTNYGVTLQLNADRQVVRATAASLYEQPAETCRRLDAKEAISELTDIMRERGGLNENANTLLFGCSDDQNGLADELIEAYGTGDYCVMRVNIDNDESIKKLADKRHITLGKAALLTMLNDAPNGVRESLLFRLSANDIALITEYNGITCGSITISGTPCDGSYLSAEEVKRIALETSGIKPDSIDCTLDSDGFKLIYTVLLFEKAKGTAYMMNAATGEILRVIHADANALRQEVEQAREEFAAASVNTPPEQTAQNQTPTPTTAAYVLNPTESTALPASEKSVPTSAALFGTEPYAVPTPTEKTSPSVPPTTAPSTEATAPRHDYLTAKQWDELPPLDDIRIVTAALCGSSPLSANDRYGSCLMKSAQAAAQYMADEPSRTKGMDYETSDYNNYSLAAVETRERYSNENLNTVIFFIRGDTLYVGVFEHTVNTPLQKGRRDVRYDYMIRKEELSGVKQLRMVQLSYDDVFNSSLESMYFNNSRLNNLKRNTWCEEIPEDVFSTKYMVDVNLRLFNDTLYDPYPRQVDLSDNNEAYDHTAWLIRSGTGLIEFKRSVDRKLANLNYPSDAYMLNHALLITTYVERYNIYSYYVRAWKKDGVLYVAFTDESSGGSVRSPLDKLYVRVGMIEFEYEQVKDVDRVEIVHVKSQFGKHGTEFVSVGPWDE